MPIKGGQYRVRTLKDGTKLRLHFSSNGKVNEVKNLSTGKTHTPAEFAADRAKSRKKKMQ